MGARPAAHACTLHQLDYSDCAYIDIRPLRPKGRVRKVTADRITARLIQLHSIASATGLNHIASRWFQPAGCQVRRFITMRPIARLPVCACNALRLQFP